MTPATGALDAAGISYSVHQYDHDPGRREFGLEAAEFLAGAGIETEAVFKTLVVMVDDRPGVAIIPVADTLSFKAVGRALGGKRVEMCPAERAQRITGYVLGGISPFGQKTPRPTAIDETAELFDTIYVSGGRRGLDLGVAPGDLIAVLQAHTAPLTA